MGPEDNYGQQAPVAYAPVDDPAAKRKRIIIGVSGMLAFIIVLIVAMVLLLSTPTIRPDLVKIAAQQQEIFRVAGIGVESDDARTSTQNLAANVRAIALTNVSTLNAWAKKNSTGSFTKGELNSRGNESIDGLLAEAGANNSFGEGFEEIILELLEAGNQQIASSNSVFDGLPILQESLKEISTRNKVLIDAISSE